jgi:hypothetical protein
LRASVSNASSLTAMRVSVWVILCLPTA